MAQQHLLGFLVLLTCFYLPASSRPSNNESSSALKVEMPVEEFEEQNYDQERSMPDEETVDDIQETNEENTKEILDKIKAINDQLKRPHRQQIHYYQPPFTGGGYVLDKAILEKIQKIIASGNKHGSAGAKKVQGSNSLVNENDELKKGYSRALRYIQPALTNNALQNPAVALVPMPYISSLPVIVMPSLSGYANNDLYSNNDINSLQSTAEYSTRQRPSFPFQIQWPLAQFFPVLIKDPLLHYLQGGTWENLVDYGQNADVCNRKQKASDSGTTDINSVEEIDIGDPLNNAQSLNPVNIFSSRQGRKIKKLKKRTVSKTAPMQTLVKKQTAAKSSSLQSIQDIKHLQNIFGPKTTTLKPVKKVEANQDTKTSLYDDGDLRMPFGDFTWFGNRKPVAPSPGFFINRLRVRQGGVAIAGPGGVATAGRGGTAVVGPGGLAYTQPGGLAVAGPAARVVALSSDTDLNSVITRLQQQQAITHGSVSRLLQAIPEGKVVATDMTADGEDGETGEASEERAGTITKNTGTTDSSLSALRTQYLPFYGGAKGQYLEVKKDTAGTVVSEQIVSEENISSENIVKNTEENLIAKVLAANLQNLKMLSTSALRLHNLGRKTGSLSNTDKARFKSDLSSLGEAASNTIKLIEEVGDNVDVLFKNNASKRQYEADEEDVGEEGVGIDSPVSNDPEIPLGALEGTIIAQASPIGLAVVGEQGLAASRPQATAVAASGIAIANPVSTAIAGIDPTLLGIDFHINKP